MRLGGLIYTNLTSDPEPPVTQRIGWLMRDPDGYHPQPYEQLAAYYRGLGQDGNARRVLIAKSRTHRRMTPCKWQIPRLARPLFATVWRIPGWLFDALSGYGYLPWRAFWWLVTAVATGTVLLNGSTSKPTGNDTMNALLLALDSAVPTTPFGIRDGTVLTGTDHTVTLALHVLGYVLVLAALPAVARARGRAGQRILTARRDRSSA